MAMAAASATAEQATFESSLLCWVQQSLKHHLYGNATFLAERLHAHAPSEDSVHVLASCHFAAGEKVRAYHVLQGCHAAHNRYLLALCCLELGHLNEAERVLLGPAAPGTAGGAHAPPAEAADVPNGAAGLYLLGTICFKSQRREQAARYFTRALELNPYLWSAYEGLCQLGVELPPLGAAAAPQLPQGLPWAHPANGAYADPSAGAQQTAPRASQPIHAPGSQAPGSAMPATPAPFSPAGFSPAGGLFAFTPMSLGAGGPLSPLPALSASVPGPVTAERGMGVVGMWGQPSSAGTPMSDSPDPAQVGAPARWRAGGGAIGGAMGGWLLGLGSAGGSAPFSAGGVGSAAELAATPVVDESARASSQRKATRASSGSALAAASGAPPVRRSSRLSGGAPQFGTTPAAGGHSGEADLPLGVGAENAEGVCPAAALLHHLARALLAVCTYRCAEALQLFDELSPRQRRTGWVLCQQGRAHFESVNYAEAERAFSSALLVEPHRLAGHELHSTLLWHLRAEVKLSYLAQHSVALDRKSAHAWAIMGNCFSLQKEHDTALRFLNRAIQLSPDFAYAHTLCGHEYAAIEDFDKALAAYRRAILLDERHYNGWYGLGSVYFRQEKYDLAEFHLARALQINAGSSPLQCYLGMALHEKALAEGARPVRALAVLERAIELDSQNPLARFQKARVLLSLDERQLALEELLALREFAPKEGAVHLLLGRIYKKLGQPQPALVCMSTALDLNPKDAQMIKAAIHKLNSADDDDVDDGP